MHTAPAWEMHTVPIGSSTSYVPTVRIENITVSSWALVASRNGLCPGTGTKRGLLYTRDDLHSAVRSRYVTWKIERGTVAMVVARRRRLNYCTVYKSCALGHIAPLPLLLLPRHNAFFLWDFSLSCFFVFAICSDRIQTKPALLCNGSYNCSKVAFSSTSRLRLQKLG